MGNLAERSVTPLSDEALLEAYRQGSEAALSLLVDRYRKPAYHTALAVLGDPAAAEDAVQVAMVRLTEAAARLQLRGSFRRWFTTLVRNAARNACRARNRRQNHERSAATRRRVDERGALDAVMAAELIEHHLRRLPPLTRRALALRYLEGRSYKEIADTLRCPEATAVSRVRRGLERLRASLLAAGHAALVPGLVGWLRRLRGPRHAQRRVASIVDSEHTFDRSRTRPVARPHGARRAAGLLALTSLALLLSVGLVRRDTLSDARCALASAAAQPAGLCRVVALPSTRGAASPLRGRPVRLRRGLARTPQRAAVRGGHERMTKPRAAPLGRVFEAHTARPIEGARVYGALWRDGVWTGDMDPVAYSDAEGRFRLRALLLAAPSPSRPV